MEIDSGAGVSIISESIFKKKFQNVKLEKTKRILKTYTGEQMIPLGCANLKVEYNNIKSSARVIVATGNGTALMGRDLMKMFKLDIVTVNCLNNLVIETELKELVKKYHDLFDGGLGCYKGEEISLKLKEEVKPLFKKPRPVPFAFRKDIDMELDRLEKEGIISFFH